MTPERELLYKIARALVPGLVDLDSDFKARRNNVEQRRLVIAAHCRCERIILWRAKGSIIWLHNCSSLIDTEPAGTGNFFFFKRASSWSIAMVIRIMMLALLIYLAAMAVMFIVSVVEHMS